MKAKTGIKFTARYGVKDGHVYRGDTEALKIPGKDHPLYDPTAPTTFDPVRVAAIDRDGHMTTPIEVWTDPDTSTLWVLDGRGRALDVREVNRRRKADKRDLIEPLLVPFDGDEKAAILRVREKNYHRRQMTPSGMATDLRVMRKAGHSWEACAAALHVETENAEAWGRTLLPLAFCCPEVQKAIDEGEIPRTSAKRFGGSHPEGEKKLSRAEQIDKLEEMLRAKKDATKRRPDAVTPKQRERLLQVLGNGGAEKLKDGGELLAALAVRGMLARLDGHKGALDRWPKLKDLVEAALAPLPKGPKPKKEART